MFNRGGFFNSTRNMTHIITRNGRSRISFNYDFDNINNNTNNRPAAATKTAEEKVKESKDKELSLFYVKNNMHDAYMFEENRLDSFKYWDYAETEVDKENLALLGFYFFGPDDCCKCYFCNVEISQWKTRDSVWREHVQNSPYCRLIRGFQTNNVEIVPGSLLASLPPASVYSPSIIETMESMNLYNQSPHILSYGRMRPPQQHEDPIVVSNIRLSMVSSHLRHPKHPYYLKEYNRIASFNLNCGSDWSINRISIAINNLTDSGLFYIGKKDYLICFSCGGGFKDWENTSDPWYLHARYYGECQFLKLMKGENYINNMIATASSPMPIVFGDVTNESVAASETARGIIIRSDADAAAAATTIADNDEIDENKNTEYAIAAAASSDTSNVDYCNNNSNQCCSSLRRRRRILHQRYDDNNLAFVRNDEIISNNINNNNNNGSNDVSSTTAIATNNTSSSSNNISDITISLSRISDYLANEATSQPQILSQPQQPQPPLSDNENNSKLCKICYQNECNIAYIPCGHIVTCEICFNKVDKCPVCRNRYTDSLRTYFT